MPNIGRLIDLAAKGARLAATPSRADGVLNPHATVVAPASSGQIGEGDALIAGGVAEGDFIGQKLFAAAS